ncbi:Uncharacterised protein [Mycobacteroides abscessus subsp. abscessus]|nr:Uncharacterised protein [Mycobacteroides abscessus subsp. abscessus]
MCCTEEPLAALHSVPACASPPPSANPATNPAPPQTTAKTRTAKVLIRNLFGLQKTIGRHADAGSPISVPRNRHQEYRATHVLR